MNDFAPATRPMRWLPPWALLLMVVASMGLGMGNQFVQDDVPIVVQNPAVANPTLGAFSEPYWPKGYSRDLYRPFATLTLALQWHLGGGAAWPVHAISIVLYGLLAFSIWGLARRMVTPAAAWLAAAWFAVHPVHVEAVAVGVNQSELMVALFAVLIVTGYIDGRQADSFGTRRAIGLAVALAVACFYKESAIVIPAILIAAELTVLRSRARPPQYRILRPYYLACILVVVAFMALRSRILGSLAGTFTAEGLSGLDLAGRTITMLGVVPDWLRLVAWPAHLQADYSPQEIVGTTSWGASEWLGLSIVLSAAVLAFSARRRAPAVTFGLLWFAIAISPVSNIAIPTGIVLAERTLLLPSAGVALALAGLVDLIAAHWSGVRLRVRQLALGTVGLLLGLGAVRSAERMTVWNNQDYLWERTVVDAPLSYRAHHARAQFFFVGGNYTLGERHALRAVELYPMAFQMRAELADRYREMGLCEPAAASYRVAIRIVPGRSDIRASLVACLLWLGRYSEARGVSRIGRAFEADDDVFVNYMALADSAEAVHAPAQSVRASLPPRFGVGMGVRIGKPRTRPRKA